MTTSDKPATIQFNFQQFAGDQHVLTLDLDAVGAHILLMCAAGVSGEGYRLPNDKRRLKTLLRNPPNEDFKRIMAQLLAGPWKISDDRQWLEQHGLKRSFELSQKQSENARKRWESQAEAKSMPESSQTDAKPAEVPAAMWKTVLARLPVPSDPPEPWQKSNQFVNVGRRPMLSYPDLWITPLELCNALILFKAKGLPETHWREVFQKAQASATNKRANGTSPDRFGAYVTITGWALEETMRLYNEEVKTKRNKGASNTTPNGTERPTPKEFIPDLPPPTPRTEEQRAADRALMLEKLPKLARKLDMNRVLN